MSDLQSTTGIVAVAAALIALAALVLALVLALRLRRLRSAQTIVLGGSDRDVVAHAAALERRVADSSRRLEDSAEALERRVADAERRLTSTVSRTAVVRYDAYNEMSGHQSSSIALLDDNATGIVLSSILHREQARFYAKWVLGGDSELDFSPEEREAIEQAMSGERGRESALAPARHPPGES